MAAPQLVDISKHEFKEPQRLVKVPEDMEKWLTCQVYCRFDARDVTAKIVWISAWRASTY